MSQSSIDRVVTSAIADCAVADCLRYAAQDEALASSAVSVEECARLLESAVKWRDRAREWVRIHNAAPLNGHRTGA